MLAVALYARLSVFVGDGWTLSTERRYSLITMSTTRTTSLLGMDREEITALVSEAGQPAYRAKQLMDAVYRQRVESLAEISTLPQEFRERLAAGGVSFGAARIEKKFESVDGTVR